MKGVPSRGHAMPPPVKGWNPSSRVPAQGTRYGDVRYPTRWILSVVMRRSRVSCGTLPMETEGTRRVEDLKGGRGEDGGDG